MDFILHVQRRSTSNAHSVPEILPLSQLVSSGRCQIGSRGAQRQTYSLYKPHAQKLPSGSPMGDAAGFGHSQSLQEGVSYGDST